MATDAARAHNCREREFARLYPTTTACSTSAALSTSATSIVRAFRLLHECPHVRERTARRFRHVLVDEYQETHSRAADAAAPAGRGTTSRGR